LANRLKKVLPSIIDVNQSAFLSGRGLLDNILVANETVDYLKKEKKSGVIVKVNFEKTYDSVDWKFLYYMLGRLGFNCKWVKWVKVCMESATISVLVNGSPTEEFKPKRGLRQGDPLAPFLFLIVAEGLAGLVREAKRVGLFKGVEVGSQGAHVDLLQFADDTIFFCEPSYHNILVAKAILRSFEVVSGLRVYFHKSVVGSVGISQLDVLVFVKCLNCRQMELPFKYLGMLIGGNPTRIEFWNPVVDKIKTRLSRWRGKMLSLAGRTCLIKSVISALPLFYFFFPKHLLLYATRLEEFKHGSFGGGDLKEGKLPG